MRGKEFDARGVCCVYSGGFRNGLREDEDAFEADSEGRVVFKGRWASGARVCGKEFDHSGKCVYMGEYRDGLWHGKGTTYDAKGNVTYSGTFERGKRDDPMVRKRLRERDTLVTVHKRAAREGVTGEVPTCALCLEAMHHGDASWAYTCGHRCLCGDCGENVSKKKESGKIAARSASRMVSR